MTKGIQIKKSGIDGTGVFATRSFKKGEIVLSWKPVPIKMSQFERISNTEKTFIGQMGTSLYSLPTPVKYVNHSCEANTKPLMHGIDVATRDIRKGEEITADYLQKLRSVGRCNCGSKECAGLVTYF